MLAMNAEELFSDIESGSAVPSAERKSDLTCTETTSSFTCPICYESCDSGGFNGEALAAVTVRECGHVFCRDCVFQYIEHHLMARKVPISCPLKVESKCTGELEKRLVESILINNNDSSSSQDQRTELYLKYRRIHSLSSDSSIVLCTLCDEVVKPPENTSSTSSTSRRCPSCAHVFCAVHGDAHPDRPCADYELELSKTNGKDLFGSLALNVKPCSHCGAFLEKFAGCDHVVCPSCHDDMCFYCGTHQYLSGTMTRYCSNCQKGFIDHRYIWRVRLFYAATFPLALPFILLYMIFSLIGIVVSCFCCGAFICGKTVSPDKEFDANRGLSFLLVILFLPFALMMHDMGIHVQVIEDFIQWNEDSYSGDVTTLTHT